MYQWYLHMRTRDYDGLSGTTAFFFLYNNLFIYTTHIELGRNVDFGCRIFVSG